MNAFPPSFGPTDPIPCDDDRDAFATVNLSMVVSREQLRAALAIGHAEAAGQPPLPELEILDVRREVEGYLAAAAIIGTEQEAATARISPELLADLDAAIDRAYPVHRIVVREQTPEYGPGTVTLDTEDAGRITISEPSWCAGHESQLVGLREEVSHVSAAIVGEFAGVEFLHACISSGPFAQVQPEPMGDVEEFPGMTPDELRDLASEVGLHAGRLYSLANQLDRIRRGMS